MLQGSCFFFLQEYALYCHHTFEKIAFPTCSAQQTCPEVGIAVSFTNTPVFTPSSWSQFCTCRASMNPHPILKQEQGTYYCWNDHPTQHVGLTSSKQRTEDEIWTCAKGPRITDWEKWLRNQVWTRKIRLEFGRIRDRRAISQSLWNKKAFAKLWLKNSQYFYVKQKQDQIKITVIIFAIMCW